MATTQFEQALGPLRQVQLGAGPLEYHERGEGRPLVFVHGLILHAGFWRKVVPALAEGNRCITPTLPLGGHRVPMRADADLSPTGIADILGDLLEALDLRDAVIVANDTGGAFTQILATRRPERIGAVVLTPSDAFEHFLPWQFRPLQWLAHVPGSAWQTAQLLRLPFVRRSPLGFGLLTARGVDDAVLASYVEGLRASAGVRRDVTKVLKGISTRHTLAAARELGRFDRPVLIAWATEEKVFPVEDARRLEALLPDARLELIDGSRTYVPEDQPERLVSLVREFLDTGARRAPSGAAAG